MAPELLNELNVVAARVEFASVGFDLRPGERGRGSGSGDYDKGGYSVGRRG